MNILLISLGIAILVISLLQKDISIDNGFGCLIKPLSFGGGLIIIIIGILK